MLQLIDESLEALLRAAVPLGAQDVDVSFEPPDRTWSAKLTRPTVNLFLWDIHNSADRSRSGVETFERDGKTLQRMALPRVELRYLVTAWTSDHGDERRLLGGLLRAVLANTVLPRDFMPTGLDGVDEPTILLTRTGAAQVDVFKTLEGQLKPALDVLLVTEVDLLLELEAAPPATGIDLSVSDQDTGATSVVPRRVAGEVADLQGAVGAKVISPLGSTTVNRTGRFLIAARPGDEIVLETDPPRTAIVPDDGGVVFS